MHISRPVRRIAGQAQRTITPLDHITIRNLRLHMSIGIHEHERLHLQPVVVNLDVYCQRSLEQEGIRSVVCYEQLANGIKAITTSGHVDLVETLADAIAGYCLADPRVHRVKVLVEKPDAILDADTVGVAVERYRPMPQQG